MSPIRIALESPHRSLWIFERAGRLVIQLHDEVRLVPREPIPLDVDVLRAIATGIPLGCSFTGDTGCLVFTWKGYGELVAHCEDEVRMVSERVDLRSLDDALEAIGLDCDHGAG